MLRSRDILQRFRPAGTPGAASSSGVPADRVAEASAELEPVLALLADAQEEAARLRADGAREAGRRRQAAAERAGATVLDAHRQAAAERAEAALRVSREAEAEVAAGLAEAERVAAATREYAVARMPAYRDRVLDAVRAQLHAGADGGP
jgi:hypothetical protein